MNEPAIIDSSREAFGKRIAVVREGFKSANQFAKALGVSGAAIHKWERGLSDPGKEKIVKIAEVTKVSLSWLLLGEGPMYLGQSLPTTVRGNHLTNAAAEPYATARPLDGYLEVPRYRLEVCAGSSTFIESEQIVDYLAFKRTWLREAMGITHSQLALIQVRGDSMTPTLEDGDLILLDLTHSNARDDAVYVVGYYDMLRVKRIYRRMDDVLVVASDNPIYADRIEIRRDETIEFDVLGKVV